MNVLFYKYAEYEEGNDRREMFIESARIEVERYNLLLPEKDDIMFILWDGDEALFAPVPAENADNAYDGYIKTVGSRNGYLDLRNYQHEDPDKGIQLLEDLSEGIPTAKGTSEMEEAVDTFFSDLAAVVVAAERESEGQQV